MHAVLEEEEEASGTGANSKCVHSSEPCGDPIELSVCKLHWALGVCDTYRTQQGNRADCSKKFRSHIILLFSMLDVLELPLKSCSGKCRAGSARCRQVLERDCVSLPLARLISGTLTRVD